MNVDTWEYSLGLYWANILNNFIKHWMVRQSAPFPLGRGHWSEHTKSLRLSYQNGMGFTVAWPISTKSDHNVHGYNTTYLHGLNLILFLWVAINSYSAAMVIAW